MDNHIITGDYFINSSFSGLAFSAMEDSKCAKFMKLVKGL